MLSDLSARLQGVADRYSVEHQIGEGAMGTAFLGLLGSAAFDDYRNRIPFGAMSPGFGGFGGAG